jgi:anti-sigma B factor antagonist
VSGLLLKVQHPSSDTVQVAVHGALDLMRAYDFDDAIRRIERDAPQRLVLDLRNLEYLDSTGLARLLALRRRCRHTGRRLVLVKGPRVVQRLFAVAAADTQFEVVADPPEAIPQTPA